MSKKVCIACSRTSYKIVPITKLNKYLHNDTSETKVNIKTNVNKGSEEFSENTAAFGKLIPVYASVFYICIFRTGY
jgi:hypothetical protein